MTSHTHTYTDHHLSPISKYLREIVYGGNDGVVTTFAVVAGFAGAGSGMNSSLPLLTVLLFGLANLFADGISMALGNYLSTRAEQDVYAKEKRKEREKIKHHTHLEKEETLLILQKKGFSYEQSQQLVHIYATNEQYWLEFMMNHELEIPNPEGDNATIMALMTCGSFVMFGLIPLLPYMIFPDRFPLFVLSILFTAAALCSIGILRWQVTAHHALRSIGETLFLGGTAALVAYLVGTFFHL